MRPILFELFGLPFASWYVFFALAGLGAYVLAATLLYRASLTRDSFQPLFQSFPALFFICYSFGWLGARGFSIAFEQFEVRSPGDILAALFSLGPMTFYGGALASFLAGVVFAKVMGLRVAPLADACLPAALLALSLGRVGCHLNGDDYGRPLSSPQQDSPPWWAVRFPNLEDGGLFRYPVQLLEAGFSLGLAALGTTLFLRIYVRGKTR